MMQYDRTQIMIGNKNMNLIKAKSVLIVGLGGVGGMTFEMLARCGIENMYLIDYDTFEETNLNRQILSSKNNIGNLKVDIAKKKAKEINPDIKVTSMNMKVDENSNLPITDYIIDACDDVNAKVFLVKFAIKHNIKIISCCGTGNRLKPELLKITNIWKTNYDPLAKKFRYMLRKENINYKLPVISSDENPVKTNGVVGSLAFVPNCAGILLASYVINDIINNS